jgi:tRNA(Arg) A34 adenosine deaminase TadA
MTVGISGCVMYSSSKPCPMCEATAYWAGLDQYFHGRNITEGGAPLLCG